MNVNLIISITKNICTRYKNDMHCVTKLDCKNSDFCNESKVFKFLKIYLRTSLCKPEMYKCKWSTLYPHTFRVTCFLMCWLTALV